MHSGVDERDGRGPQGAISRRESLNWLEPFPIHCSEMDDLTRRRHDAKRGCRHHRPATRAVLIGAAFSGVRRQPFRSPRHELRCLAALAAWREPLRRSAKRSSRSLTVGPRPSSAWRAGGRGCNTVCSRTPDRPAGSRPRPAGSTVGTPARAPCSRHRQTSRIRIRANSARRPRPSTRPTRRVSPAPRTLPRFPGARADLVATRSARTNGNRSAVSCLPSTARRSAGTSGSLACFPSPIGRRDG